jgi:hypothetical protein
LAKFGHDLPLEYKNAINELSFPLVTHIVDSDARFCSHGILKFGQGAEQIPDRRMSNQVLRAE